MRVLFRIVVVVLGAGAAIVVSRPGNAYVYYPWCTTGAGHEFGARNCGFTTFEQCMATARGNGQMCEPNPFRTDAAAPKLQAVPKHKKRR